MSMELILGMIALFGMAAIGTPVAYAILFGVLVYLGVSRSAPGHRWHNHGAAPL